MTRVLSQYAQLLLVSLLMVSGQLLLKKGMTQAGPIPLRPSAVLPLVLLVLRTPVLLAGWLLGSIATLVWLVLLSKLDLSYASPTLTAFYVITMLAASRLVLGETVTVWRWSGALLVVAGMLLIAREG
jgi:uncharacterized membrane protein